MPFDHVPGIDTDSKNYYRALKIIEKANANNGAVFKNLRSRSATQTLRAPGVLRFFSQVCLSVNLLLVVITDDEDNVVPIATDADVRRARHEATQYAARGVSDDVLLERRKDLLKERELAASRLVLEIQKLDSADAEGSRIEEELRKCHESALKGKAVVKTPAPTRASSPVKGHRSRILDPSDDSASEVEEVVESAEEGYESTTGVAVF